MTNQTFKVDLRADNIQEFKEDVIEYMCIRWGVNAVFEGNYLKVSNGSLKLKYDSLENIVCEYFGISPESIRSYIKQGKPNKDEIKISIAKSILIYLMSIEGYRVVDICQKLYNSISGKSKSIHANVIYRREETKKNIQKKANWSIWYEDITKQLNKINNETN